MTRTGWINLAAAVVWASSTGCLAYNDTCQPDTSEPLATLERSLDVRPQTLRTRETPAGNLIADAVLARTAGADIALIPAGALSANTACGPREFVERGPLRLGDVTALLPSDDTVVVLSITSEDLKRALERSASALASPAPPFEGFLQVSGLLFTVDCAESAQTLTGDGKAILFPGARVSEAGILLDGVALAPAQTIRVATLRSVSQGAYAFVDLSRTGTLLLDTNERVSSVVAEYLRTAGAVTPTVDGRVVLRDTCRAE